jgi:septal ring factor EnvC (AmiA/AmiB activator)
MTDQEIKLLVESIVAANKGLSIETWGLIVAIVSAFGSMVYTFFNSFEKRLLEQNEQFKQTLDEQTKVHDKINQSLLALNATLEVTNWRTKALEESCKCLENDVTLIKDRIAKNEKLVATSFVAMKGNIKKEISEELSRRC